MQMHDKVTPVFHPHPDEPAGGDPESPERASVLDVDGERIPVERLVDSYRNRSRMDQAAHERNEATRRERAALQAEREAWQRERAAASAKDDEVVQTLRSLRPAPEPDVSEQPISVSALIQQNKLDMVGDEAAPEKLAGILDNVLSQELTRREQRLMAQVEARVSKVQQDSDRKLQDTTRRLEQTKARERAVVDAEEYNRRMFDKVMDSKYGDVAKQLNDEDRGAVYREMRALVDSRYGAMDGAGQWRYNEAAAERAMWLHEPARRVLLTREVAQARREGMTGRITNERMGRSTPDRSRRAAPASDEALAQKMEHVNGLLRTRQVSADEAADMFTDTERKRMMALRRGEA